MKAEIDESGAATRVLLVGAVDEGCSEALKQLGQDLGSKSPVEFDCTQLTTINSVGLMHWCRFLAGITRTSSYSFHNCPVFLIDYANMLPAVLGHGKIVSLFAPLKCPKCLQARSVLLRAADISETSDFGSELCSACGIEMKPEVFPEIYFQCLF